MILYGQIGVSRLDQEFLHDIHNRETLKKSHREPALFECLPPVRGIYERLFLSGILRPDVATDLASNDIVESVRIFIYQMLGNSHLNSKLQLLEFY